MTVNNERKEEILRALDPKQREMVLAYEKRHTEMMAQPNKLRQWENVLMMFEEFFEVCRATGIPIEPQIQNIIAGWKENIHIDDALAKQLEKTLHEIAALTEQAS